MRAHLHTHLLYVAALFLALGLSSCDGIQSAKDEARNGNVLDGSVGGEKVEKKLAWHAVLAVNGKASRTSETFKISGQEWKISWKTTPVKGKEDEFIIILFDKANPDVSEIIVNVTGSDTDFAYLEGKGQFYLMVTTSQPYEIKIDEQR
jgi:hypothetical protein